MTAATRHNTFTSRAPLTLLWLAGVSACHVTPTMRHVEGDAAHATVRDVTSDEPTASSDEPTASSDEPTASSDEPTASSDEPTASSDEPALNDGGKDAPDSSVNALVLLEQARAEYKQWTPHTSEPVHISEQIFGLCRPATAAEEAFVESVHGHELALKAWLNPAALEGATATEAASAADAAAPAAFPVGATIVKEKLVRRNEGYEVFALGIMVKRERGFNAATADWQFGYWELEAGMIAGADEQKSCGDCHASAATDFVYLDNSWHLF
jgi:hypothetical protein